MLKGLKSVNLKIIQMYHYRLKWTRYTVCTNRFRSGTPTFCQMGVLNSCFQNSSESSAGSRLFDILMIFPKEYFENINLKENYS